MIISLTGFMGCGKSSIGRKLSGLLSCGFIDLDSRVVETAGTGIPEIFKAIGEKGFRNLEKECLGKVLKEYSGEHCSTLVLSLGGGTVTTQECADMIRENTFCIYLRASADTLTGNLEKDFTSRPMLAGSAATGQGLRARIEELMQQRSDVYTRCSNHIIDIDSKDFDTVASEIRDVLDSMREL